MTTVVAALAGYNPDHLGGPAYLGALMGGVLGAACVTIVVKVVGPLHPDTDGAVAMMFE